MSTSLHLNSLSDFAPADAEWLGLSDAEFSRLRAAHARRPELTEVVAAVRSLGIEAHEPRPVPGHEGRFSIRNLETGRAIEVALRLLPKTGPLVLLDVSEMIPVVVRPGDALAERVAWLNARREHGEQEARRWVNIAPLSTYQWSHRSDGQRELVRTLSWIETLGLPLPVSDCERNVTPLPNQIQEILGIEGTWQGDALWMADAARLGLGQLEVVIDPSSRQSLSLRCRSPSAADVVKFAAGLVHRFGPMVIGRLNGPSVLVAEATDLARVAALVDMP